MLNFQRFILPLAIPGGLRHTGQNTTKSGAYIKSEGNNTLIDKQRLFLAPSLTDQAISLAAKRSAVRSRYAPPSLINEIMNLHGVDNIEVMSSAQFPHGYSGVTV